MLTCILRTPEERRKIGRYLNIHPVVNRPVEPPRQGRPCDLQTSLRRGGSLGPVICLPRTPSSMHCWGLQRSMHLVTPARSVSQPLYTVPYPDNLLYVLFLWHHYVTKTDTNQSRVLVSLSPVLHNNLTLTQTKQKRQKRSSMQKKGQDINTNKATRIRQRRRVASAKPVATLTSKV